MRRVQFVQSLVAGLKRRSGQLVSEHFRLAVMLGLLSIFVLALTTVSVTVYVWNGTYKLDLSRPGYEKERIQVHATDERTTYDTTSPVTPAVVDDFLKEYDKRADNLRQYGNFHDQALDDANILTL